MNACCASGNPAALHPRPTTPHPTLSALTQHEGVLHSGRSGLSGELVEQGAHDGGARAVCVQEEGVQVGQQRVAAWTRGGSARRWFSTSACSPCLVRLLPPPTQGQLVQHLFSPAVTCPRLKPMLQCTPAHRWRMASRMRAVFSSPNSQGSRRLASRWAWPRMKG